MEKVKQFQAKYSTEFKLSVILDLVQNSLNYREVVRKYWGVSSRKDVDRYKSTVREWHRFYLAYGEDGFMAKQGRPKKPQFDYEKVKNTDPSQLSKEQMLELIVYQQAELEYLKKTKSLSSSGGTKEKAKIVSELRQKFPQKILLDISKLKKSTYHYNCKAKKDKYLLERQEILAIYTKNKGRYGYRRITCAMRQNGYVINHKTVQKLMKELYIQGKHAKRKFLNNKEEQGEIKENILNREFVSTRPREKLTTDVTELKVKNRRIYLSPVIDMYNGEVLSYAYSETPNTELVKEMLNKLWLQNIPRGAMIHSDQGSIYTSTSYQRVLQEHGIKQSMSRRGNCYDNSVMENFFGILKREMYNGEKYDSVEELKEALDRYIDYYNNERISLKLKGLSPVQYRAEYEKNNLKRE